MRTAYWVLSAVVACACTPAPAARTDAAIEADAGFPDASPPDAGSDGWRAGPALPVALQEIVAVAYRGEIWVLGGFEELDVVATVRIYRPADGTWRTGPSLPAPRHHLAATVHEGDLYVLGGMETLAFAPLDTAWVLRAGEMEWQDIAPLPQTRGAGVALSTPSTLVLVGGNEARGGLAIRPLLYRPDEDRWALGAAMPTPREHLAGEVVDGEVWAIGGRENSLSSNRDEVEIYDVARDRWRVGPTLPSARGGFTATRVGQHLVVVGGEHPGAALATVDGYDLDTQRWRPLPSLQVPRHGHGAAVLAGVLYIVGGGDAPSFAPVADVETLPIP